MISRAIERRKAAKIFIQPSQRLEQRRMPLKRADQVRRRKKQIQGPALAPDKLRSKRFVEFARIVIARPDGSAIQIDWRLLPRKPHSRPVELPAQTVISQFPWAKT